MANPEKELPSVEKGERRSELKASKVEIKRESKAEREAGEKDLASRGEKAEKVIQAEREKTRETEKVLTREKPSETERKKEPVKVARVRPKPKNRKERDTVYKHEITQVQDQLSRPARAFSKVIHNNAVEKVSDVAEKTVMRPSALIGGASCGLILGIVVYIIARINGYILGSMELVALFIAGALVGVVVEMGIRRVRS